MSVLQHAGIPSERHSGESESAPLCSRQFGLPAAVGVSFLFALKQAELLYSFWIASGLVDTSAPMYCRYPLFSFPVWWCSLPETCRLTSTPTSLTSSPSSPHCWTPRTQSSLSGLSLPSRTCTSTCGGSWWKTWPTSTSQCSEQHCDPFWLIFWESDVNTIPSQFVQHAVGT